MYIYIYIYIYIHNPQITHRFTLGGMFKQQESDVYGCDAVNCTFPSGSGNETSVKKSEIRNPNFGTRKPNFETRNPNFETRNPNFETRNPKPEL